MKFQFPRHLFTPLLIYDAINEATPAPKAPPAPPDIWAKVEIVPVIEYIQKIYQRSVAETTQSAVATQTFTIVVAGGTLDVKNIRSKQTITTKLDSTIVVDNTVINDLQMNVPQMFANVLVPGDTQNTNDLRTKVQVAVKSVITQENIQKIIQSSYDFNKFEMYVRGKLTIDGDLDSDQTIVTRLVAVNIIQALVNQSGVLNMVSQEEAPSEKKKVNILALVIAVVSSIICLILFLMLIIYGTSSKRGT